MQGIAADLGQVGVAGDAAERRARIRARCAGCSRRCTGLLLRPPGTGPAGPASVGTAKTAIAGAAATATANPPARISRRAEISKVAIVTLSVVIDRLVGRILWKLTRNLHRFHEFPGNPRPTCDFRQRPDLGAGADGGARYRLWPRGLRLLSASPMHAPESRPVQGTPSISGMSGLAAVVVKPPASSAPRTACSSW